MGEVIDLRKHRELERRGAEMEEVVVGELVDDDDAPIPVNPARELEPRTLHGKVLERAEVKPEPWIAAWLRVPEARRDVVRYYGARSLHACVFHSLRAPIYAGKAAARAPVGTARVAVRTAGWVFDREAAPLRSTAVANDDIGDYLRLAGLRNDRVRLRLSIIGALALAVVVAAVVGQRAAPHLFALGCALAVFVLGFIGRRRDKPIIGRSVSRENAPRLTDEVLVCALEALRIPGITAALKDDRDRAIRFTGPITRDGKGWRAEVELPAGVVATDVMKSREAFAGALCRPLGCVWLSCNTEIHPGMLTIWVGDKDMSAAKQAPWPLLKSGTVDLFKPFPFGTDQRGQPVHITLMFASVVIGAIPRVGKTFALRLLLLAAGLDVRAELHVYDLKGTGDLSALARIAHRYRCGDDDDDIEYLLADLCEVRLEMRRRSKVIRELPRDLCPENKVTPELAGKTSLGLHPIVIGLDECQCAYENSQHGDEIAEIAEDIVRRGPALGIMLINATQRPNASALPTGISANAILRFCLKVMGQTENDMILGTSSYKNGIRATMFARRDKGIGLLLGEGDDPIIVRTAYLDGPASERVVTRAHNAKIAAGRLTGYALGEDREPESEGPRHDLLTDILACVGPMEEKVWSCTLLTALAELRPDAYEGWDETTFAKALGAHAVKTIQISKNDDNGVRRNQRGVEIQVVREAAQARGERGSE